MAFFSLIQSIISDLIVAVLIIFLGLIISRFLGNLTMRILKEVEVDRLIKDYSIIVISIEDLIGTVVKYLAYFFTVIIALNQIGITGIVIIVVLVLGVLITIGIVLFDLKDFFHNLFIGLFSGKRKNFKLNKEIKLAGIKGKVEEVRIKEIVIKTKKDDLIIVPSSLW